MTGPFARRGQPVLVLGAILLAWVAARLAAWHAPVVAEPAFEVVRHPDVAPAHAPVATLPLGKGAAMPTAAPVLLAPAPVTVEIAPRPQPRPQPQPQPQIRSPAQPPAFAPVSAAVAGGHGLLWMAAVSRLPLPAAFATLPPAAAPALRDPVPANGLAARAANTRWTVDGWLLLRGGKAPQGAAAFATYGASQVGAVVRYRIAPQSAHRAAATLRGGAALTGSGEREVALGLAARPVATLPVGMIAELRATRRADGAVKLRPAITAVTELAPQSLPLGLRAQAYGQAGYVGGAGATAFADGEARVEGPVARHGPAELTIGAAAWGGAQEGAARLDIGPTISLGINAAGKAARLGLDWRVRVAGDAAPASGPALTLSAGF